MKRVIKWAIITVVLYAIMYALSAVLLMFIGVELAVDQLNGGNFEVAAYRTWDMIVRTLWYVPFASLLFTLFLGVKEALRFNASQAD